MRKLKKVVINNFWGDKTVTLNFNESINFLIGANGSGKTTIINLIAASLNADFATLDKTEFSKIRLDFFPLEKNELTQTTFIEVTKSETENSLYSKIKFSVKLPEEKKTKTFDLNNLEEEHFYRYNEYHRTFQGSRIYREFERNISFELRELINLTWLSIHRASYNNRNNEDRNFESSVDMKIRELSSNLVKYFGILDKQYSEETDTFQKNVLLSLIENESGKNIIDFQINVKDEKEALKQIFKLFKLKENEFKNKLETHFSNFEDAQNSINQLTLEHFVYLINTKRIHYIVQEWNKLNDKKNNINKPKTTFINEINSLFQNKKIYINERNELLALTSKGKALDLIKLSSGEKQLIIILGQALLQENKNHIYIADEPELSLHVEWQEKLVDCLKNVNPNSQIIFATHSPDIVGKYSNNITKVEEVVQ